MARMVIRLNKLPSELMDLPLGERLFISAAFDIEDEVNKKRFEQ